MSSSPWTDLFSVMAGDAWKQAGVPMLEATGKSAALAITKILTPSDAPGGSTKASNVFEKQLEALYLSYFNEARACLERSTRAGLSPEEKREMVERAFDCFHRSAYTFTDIAAARAKFLAAVCAELKGSRGIAEALYEEAQRDAEKFVETASDGQIRQNFGDIRMMFTRPFAFLKGNGEMMQQELKEGQLKASAELIQGISAIRENRALPPAEESPQEPTPKTHWIAGFLKR